RLRAALKHGDQMRTEALRTQGDAVDARIAQVAGELAAHRLRIRLDGDLLRRGQCAEQADELGQRRVGGRAAAEEDRLQRIGEQSPLRCELPQERVDVRAVLVPAADGGDEVAV